MTARGVQFATAQFGRAGTRDGYGEDGRNAVGGDRKPVERVLVHGIEAREICSAEHHRSAGWRCGRVGSLHAIVEDCDAADRRSIYGERVRISRLYRQLSSLDWAI